MKQKPLLLLLALCSISMYMTSAGLLLFLQGQGPDRVLFSIQGKHKLNQTEVPLVGLTFSYFCLPEGNFQECHAYDSEDFFVKYMHFDNGIGWEGSDGGAQRTAMALCILFVILDLSFPIVLFFAVYYRYLPAIAFVVAPNVVLGGINFPFLFEFRDVFPNLFFRIPLFQHLQQDYDIFIQNEYAYSMLYMPGILVGIFGILFALPLVVLFSEDYKVSPG